MIKFEIICSHTEHISKTLALEYCKSQRVEKVKLQISTRCQTLRNGAEFCILRRKMYDGTSTEQKAKNAEIGLDSMSKPISHSIC